MIVEHMKNSKGDNRGRVKELIRYICGKTKHCRDSDGQNITKDVIDFVGCSASLPLINPMVSQVDGLYKKLDIESVDLDPLIEEFLKSEANNNRVKQPFEHFIISLKENESLNLAKWNLLVTDIAKELGFTDHHWVAFRHLDTDNEHCHLVCSTISNAAPFKRLVLGNSFKTIAFARKKLEKKYNLSTDISPYVDGIGKKINNAKYKTRKQTIRTAIDQVLNSSTGIELPKLIEQLNNIGIGSYVQTRNGDIRGISFSVGSFKCSGSKLGIGYSWKQLQAGGIRYKPAIHQEHIELSNAVERDVINEIEKYSLPRIQPTNKTNLVIKLFSMPLTPSKTGKKNNNRQRYSRWGIWMIRHKNFKGMTKNQIENHILFQRMLRKLLALYFNWLRKKDREKEIAYEKLKPYLVSLNQPEQREYENSFTF